MLAPLPRLGVGLAYQAPLSALFDAASGDVDYVEVVPDIFWTDRGTDAAPRHLDDDAGLARMRRGQPISPEYGHAAVTGLSDSGRLRLRQPAGRLLPLQRRL